MMIKFISRRQMPLMRAFSKIMAGVGRTVLRTIPSFPRMLSSFPRMLSSFPRMLPSFPRKRESRRLCADTRQPMRWLARYALTLTSLCLVGQPSLGFSQGLTGQPGATTASAVVPARASSAIDALQRFLKSVQGARGQFEQQRLATGKESTSKDKAFRPSGAAFRGEFAFARPGLFVWDVREPEALFTLVKQGEVSSFDAGLNQVTLQYVDERFESPMRLLMSENTASLSQQYQLKALSVADAEFLAPMLPLSPVAGGAGSNLPAASGTSLTLARSLAWLQADAKQADAVIRQVWIGWSDQGLPMIMLFKDAGGQWTRVQFTQWQLGIKPSDPVFQWRPPAGVEQLDLRFKKR